MKKGVTGMRGDAGYLEDNPQLKYALCSEYNQRVYEWWGGGRGGCVK
jgi:hypothetical protein